MCSAKPTSKRFSLIAGDNGVRDIRAALERRGWQEADEGSYEWDFQWSVVADKIEYDTLRADQIVNHYQKAAAALTTKRGLLHSLNEAQWITEATVSDWFPRCYDLSEKGDVASFQVSTLRQIVATDWFVQQPIVATVTV